MLRNTIIIAVLAALGPRGNAAAEQSYEGPGSGLWIEARLITTYSLNVIPPAGPRSERAGGGRR